MARPSKTGVRGLTKKGNRYFIDLRWREPGTNQLLRHRENLPVGTSAAVAKTRAQKVLSAALDGTYVTREEADEGTTAVRTLHSILDDWEAHMEGERPKSRVSRQSLVRIIKTTVPFDENPAVDEIAPFALERFKAARTKSGAAPATVNRSVAALMASLRWAAGMKWVSRDLVAELAAVKKRQEPAGRERELRPAEGKRLAKAMSGAPIRPLLITALLTGLRRANVAGLRKSYVDLEHMKLRIPRDTKNNKVQVTDIAPALKPILVEAMGHYVDRNGERHDNASRFVFLNTNGMHYTPDGLSTEWAKVRTKAKLKPTLGPSADPDGFRFHDLRHTFASQVRRGGAQLDVLRRLLGHSTIALTNRYAHLGDDATRDAVAELSVVGG